ncbi:MAG: AarF/ABC1/UbiB kinase family protein [Rhodospirillales bacterium]|nr:AarF/ABC1/UbiB kinase family protein [Rhodospirillales bacterium]
MSDENSLAGRVKRYAKVGAVAGGFAARAAGNRMLGTAPDNAKNAADLQAALGGLKGPLMKVAQILSTLPDMLPDDYMAELAKLQAQAPAMGWSFVRRRMAGELGADWASRYSSFERQAAAAASLGQVHRAVGLDDQPLACKIQYPDMGSAVEADLTQLKMVFSLYKRYDKAIDPSNIHSELSERLREELDYKREARNMGLFRYIHDKEAAVHVPVSLPELSTARLLTMTWMEGTPLMQWLETDVAQRNQIATNMFRAWYVPLYYYGVLHGDPHLGNYTVADDCSLNLMDFGCIRVFRPEFIGAVIDLYHAIRDKDQALAVHAYETWGFQGLQKSVIDILNQWAEFLYAPLLQDRVMPIQETGGVSYGAGVAAKIHRELREIGGVMPPREFVLMDRAAIGLGSVFTHLRAEINWHRMFHELIDDFDVDVLAKRQAAALRKFDIPPSR